MQTNGNGTLGEQKTELDGTGMRASYLAAAEQAAKHKIPQELDHEVLADRCHEIDGKMVRAELYGSHATKTVP
jgi:lactam utilization protein B